MQLRAAALPVLAIALAASGHAQHRASVGTSVFSESRGPLGTLVIAPRASVGVQASEAVMIEAGYDADIVSAATIAIVDSQLDVDAITSATVMEDVRHSVSAGTSVVVDDVTLRAGYRFGIERDYRAHVPRLGLSIDAFDRASRIDVGLSVAFDEICDARQSSALAVDRQKLGSSEGCFGGDRATRELTTGTLDLAWSQAVRPDLVLALRLSGQRSDGFQSSPYREVWLGPWAAQEHHPSLRHRGSASLEARLALPAIASVLLVRARGYADDWGMTAASAEAALDVALGAGVRVGGRVRAYTQSGVAFYSDDYALRPRGQYFTGDRELSPMTSVLGGARASFRVTEALPIDGLSGLVVSLAADVSRAEYPSFHYGRTAVPDGVWVLGELVVSGEME